MSRSESSQKTEDRQVGVLVYIHTESLFKIISLTFSESIEINKDLSDTNFTQIF